MDQVLICTYGRTRWTIGGYNEGVIGYMQISAGTTVNVTHWTPGDEIERDGWAFAQIPWPRGYKDKGWIPRRILNDAEPRPDGMLPLAEPCLLCGRLDRASHTHCGHSYSCIYCIQAHLYCAICGQPLIDHDTSGVEVDPVFRF